MNFPAKQDIIDAHKRINPFVHNTPILSSQLINEIAGCEIVFKCENFQKVGAFKYRGATNALSLLNKDQLSKGVATHSSGNHAQALALAAKLQGIKAYIVMPNNAPKSKKNAVIGYGAEVIECIPTLDARESTVKQVISKTDAHLVHPYNDERIITGQATCAYEVFEKYQDLEFLLTPVGGGGLLSGTALSAHYFAPSTKVIGAEPEGADDAYQSFKTGKLIPSINPQTIADGLLTSLGNLTFPIIHKHVRDIVTVSEEGIVEAMKLIWQRMKLVVEPSAAVPLAALLKNKQIFARKKVGIILSGGNIDFDKLPF